MPRPKKIRRVECCPDNYVFGPKRCCIDDIRIMRVEVFETIRLLDYENMTQEQAATSMKVARTTVQRLYKEARALIAQSLMDGFLIRVDGGTYTLKKEKQSQSIIRCGKEEVLMKVIVSLKNDQIAEVYKEADKFLLYTVEKGEVVRKDTIIPDDKNQAGCRRFMISLGIDALITGSMNEHTYQRFIESGIEVFYGENEPEKAIHAYLNSQLKSLKKHVVKDVEHECCGGDPDKECCEEDEDCCNEEEVTHKCCGNH